MRDIVCCRTEVLGGSLYRCDDCDRLEYAYHSCRNRHCPKCHRHESERWLRKLRSLLLPCPYYLLTFTLPSTLRPLARSHQRTVYNILLREAANSVLLLTRDRRWVGGRPGILAVLHTWTRDIAFHPHVHLLVTAGGLASDGAASENGSTAWMKPARPRFLLPGYALSKLFRAKVRDALGKADLLAQADPAVFQADWVVHVKHAGNGEHTAEYLSRYIYRVAITDSRIERDDNGSVTFRFKHSKTHQIRSRTLPVDTFIARFLQHVLPARFVKVRYYGLWSPNQRARLELAREILEAMSRQRSPQSSSQPEASGGHDIVQPRELRCRICQKPLRFIRELPPGRGPP